jgi:hypothetical protein
VFFVLGNRDLNKLRFFSELTKMADFVKKGEYKPWKTFKDADKYTGGADDKVARLKWILSKSMGAGDSFAFRKAELEILQKPNADEDIFNSFVSEVEPGTGNMWKYLEKGHLALKIGKNFFSHGKS